MNESLYLEIGVRKSKHDNFETVSKTTGRILSKSKNG